MKYQLTYPNGKKIITNDFEEVLQEREWHDALVTKQIAETVEDEDMLRGHPYPGHECWED